MWNSKKKIEFTFICTSTFLTTENISFFHCSPLFGWETVNAGPLLFILKWRNELTSTVSYKIRTHTNRRISKTILPPVLQFCLIYFINGGIYTLSFERNGEQKNYIFFHTFLVIYTRTIGNRFLSGAHWHIHTQIIQIWITKMFFTSFQFFFSFYF